MKFLNLVLFAAKDRKTLKLIKPFTDESNLKLLKGTSLTCIILLILPLLEIIVFKELSHRVFLYSSFLILSTSIYTLACLFAKKYPAIILPLFYLMFITCLSYGTWLGVFETPELTGVTFNVVLFVFPLLVSDMPWHSDVIIVLFGCIYLFFSRKVKPNFLYNIEFMNVMNSMVLSLIISTIRQIQNVNDYTARFLLKRQRDTDSLSGLNSRMALKTNLELSFKKASNSGCIMFIDVDNFKHINDTYGHDIGDEMIIEIGHCLRQVSRETDLTGRYGGDEFIIFFSGKADNDFAEKKANEILEYVKNCDLAKRLDENISVSIGCILFENIEKKPEELISEADNLLYIAKDKGKNQVCIKTIMSFGSETID